MWERFTYYGMRAILVLFMWRPWPMAVWGSMTRTASAIFGLFVAGSYLLSLFGGWIADTPSAHPGRRRRGGFIMVGNALLASGTPQVFFVGLVLIALGVGLLKPNISALVANLYPEGGRGATPVFRCSTWASTWVRVGCAARAVVRGTLRLALRLRLAGHRMLIGWCSSS